MISTTAATVAATVFGVLLFVLPWFYGGVEEGVRANAALAMAVVVLASSIRLVATPDRESSFALLLIMLPTAGLIGLACAQLAGGLVPADSNGAFNVPKSIYPAETRLALASLIAVVAALLVGGTVFSREASFHGLLALCLTAAAVVGFGGIAMRLTGDDRIVSGVATLGEPFARFINRNNAAAFLQLGIASGLALLRSASRPRYLDDDPTFLARGWRSLDRSTLVIIVALLLALCLAGVVTTQSRGGLLAAACMVSAAATFFRWQDLRSRIVILAAPLAIATGLLLWLGLSSATVERFESMSLEKLLTTGRIPHWLDASHAVEARPGFGAGFGTYGYAFQQFSQQDYEVWFQHADNQYLELVVEAGAAGALALAATAALSIFGISRGSRKPVERLLVATVVAGQAVHAVFDFGVIIPATALGVAALWSAGMVRLLTNEQNDQMEWSRPRDWLSTTIVVGTTICLAGGLYWSSGEHARAWEVDRHAKLVRELDQPEPVDPKRLERSIEGLTAALQDRPDDALGHQILAELLVHRYRVTAADQIREAAPSISAQSAKRLTELTSLHQRIHALIRSGAKAGVDGLRFDPLVRQNLIPARRHYLAAVETCPRLPGVWNPLACLAFLDPEDGLNGTSLLETALGLFPANPELLRTAGRIAWQAGDVSLAGRCWRQAFEVQPAGYWDYVSRLAVETAPSEAVWLTCPQKWDSILQVATNVPSDAGVEMRKLVGMRLESATATQPEGMVKQRAFAAVDCLAGRPATAEDRLRVLIDAHPSEATLHGDLAVLLRNAGKLTEALDEATLASVLDDRYEALRQQIESRVRNMPSHQDLTAVGSELRTNP